MKKLELGKLRQQNNNQLQKQILDLRHKLQTARVQMYSKGEGNLKQGRSIRRDIAQIMSIINEPKKEETK